MESGRDKTALAKLVKPNHLLGEKSPYLLQYAYNPVDWFPWGQEAFSKARKEGKPIFLSIGYSTCHWCHVQNEESFENKDIAALLNEKFVPIKVDREERPDLDEVYMKAVTSLTGQGGWPLSVFLTPDLKPFYGGTYFPPVARHGLPAFPDVLNFVSDAWNTKREEIVKSSDELVRSIKEGYDLKGEGEISKVLLDNAYALVLSAYDPQYGGFGGAPKFPLPSYVGFLLRYHWRTRKEPALSAVKKTLDAMVDGGIHDHLGGGFHRYSTDRYWLVPHFEKMLYDNALLAKVYADAYRVTKIEGYGATARDTLDWMVDEMSSPEGAFYSAQDADTPEGEGFYYTWTPSEVAKVLGKEAPPFCQYYGITAEGNFESGRSILSVTSSVERAAEKMGTTPEHLAKTLEDGRSALLAARRERHTPEVDDKVLASWNGLAISGLSCAYQAIQDQAYLAAAKRSAEFVLTRLVKKGRSPSLYRRYRDGEVAIAGNLEDYSFTVAGLIDLYESSLEGKWMDAASDLAEEMVGLFWDHQQGGFFLSPPPGELVPIKESYDGPTPSGNSVAAMDLLRLSEFTGKEDLREMAETTLKLFAEPMESTPTAHLEMLGAVDFSFGSQEIVVAGTAGQLADVIREIQARYLPNKVLAFSDGSPLLVKLTEGKSSLGGRPTVYVCQNFACRAPVTEPRELAALLDAVPAGAGG